MIVVIVLFLVLTWVPLSLAHRCLELQYLLGGFFLSMGTYCPSTCLLISFGLNLLCQILKWLAQLASWLRLLGITLFILLIWSGIYF